MTDTNKLEQRILSILLFNSQYMRESELTLDLFQYKANQDVFSILKECYVKHDKVDLLLIAEKLNEFDVLDYTMKLQDSYVSASTFYDDLEILSESKAIREIEKYLNEYKSDSITFEELKSEISKTGITVSNNNASELTVEQIEELITSSDNDIKFTTMDYMNMVRLKEHTLVVIGARTGIGKSAFALNVLNDLASTYRCIYFNMEMTEKETYQRIVSMNSRIPAKNMSKLDPQEKNILSDSIYKMKRNKNFYVYNGSQSVGSIRKVISKESRNGHVIAFIDYVGLIKDRRYTNITQRVTEVTKELQTITKDFDCTIFLLAQINRQGTGDDKPPRMEHLKDSGELEQSADTIILLHCDSKDIGAIAPPYMAMVPKSRSGYIGTFYLTFMKDIQTFKEQRKRA